MVTEKDKRQASRTIILWVIVALLVAVGGTYAWFTFQSMAVVEPDTAGTVTEGEDALLISASANGPFKESCVLDADIGGNLVPVSTDDLNDYYKAISQNTKGISILFRNATKDIPDYTIRGNIYLKAANGAQDVYLYKERMTFGDDVQAIAAMRLGIRITTGSTVKTYIFKLDDMADTSKAESMYTTAKKNVVVGSISNGAPNYKADPAQNIGTYSANGKNADDDRPTRGDKKLITLSSGDIAEVEYWLYLEGCDVNCINSVQKKDAALSLSFAAFANN